MHNHNRLPVVSITIAAYNVSEWLRPCLDSVASQTYPYFECIIINDCSSDITPEIAKEYTEKDSRFILIEHDVNSGLAAARKTGLDNCTGKYVWQIDGDDYIAEDALEELVGIAERDNCDLVRGRFVSDNGKSLMKDNITTHTPVLSNVTFEDSYIYLYAHSIWLNMFRTDFIREINVPDYSKIDLGEDIVFDSYAFSKARTISTTNRIIYYYRLREGSYTRTNLAKRRYMEEAKAHAITYKNYDGFPIVQIDFMINFSSHRMNWIKNCCNYCSKPLALDVISEFKKLYAGWNPHLAYTLAKKNRHINWNPEKNPHVMRFAELMHVADREAIYQSMIR